MKDLNECREEIDRIDTDLVRLFEERMNVVQEVAAYKKAHNMPVLDSSREQKVIDKCTALLKNKDYAPALEEWLKLTMKLSRASETEKIDQK